MVLRTGNTGTEVGHVQRLLNKLGEQLKEDGVYGPKTRDAVERFQQRVKANIDGMVGSETFQKLVSESNKFVQIDVPKMKPEMAEKFANTSIDKSLFKVVSLSPVPPVEVVEVKDHEEERKEVAKMIGVPLDQVHTLEIRPVEVESSGSKVGSPSVERKKRRKR